MAKKTWVKPMTLVQKFEANETIAAQCYEVACGSDAAYGNQKLWENIKINAPFGHQWVRNEGYSNGNNGGTGIDLPPSFNHNGDCKTASKNIFRIDGNNIVFLEEQTGDGSLSGGVDWYDLGSDGILNTNDVVYWHTDKGSVRWNHWGYLTPITNNHPNRS